ncbi:hypothetical protein ACP70R_016103 [Stipagrostis hirtigluma subsp. patula]
MDAAAAATMDPAPLPTMEVLLDRCVMVINELREIMKETGCPSMDETMESVVQALPDCSSWQERERLEQAAIEAEIERYTAEVEAPAYALLRERKASRPSAVRKEPVVIVDDDAAAAFYREVLDGVEPYFPQLAAAAAPAVTSLSLRVALPPNHPMLHCALTAVIASSDAGFLALYVGPYRPGYPGPGFYLVYNTCANSVAIVPPLPASSVFFRSHCHVGPGVAVVRHGDGKYLLTELLFRKDSKTGLVTNNASLFLWWPAGPLAGRWTRKDVVLPLPTTHFRGDVVFAAGNLICWVDLLTGILVCEGLAAGAADDGPVFRFIPLPKECIVEPIAERGQPEEYRSMCCINTHTFKFVSLDGYSQGRPISEVILRTWTLDIHQREDFQWSCEASFSIKELWNDPIYNNDLKLEPLMPSNPIISEEHDCVCLLVLNYKYRNEIVEATGPYHLSLDMGSQRITSAFKFPSPATGRIKYPRVFATYIGWSSHKQLHKILQEMVGAYEHGTKVMLKCFR